VLAAVRAGHEVPPLVALPVLALDPRQALGLGRRDEQYLAALEGGGPPLGKQDRIALALDVARIAVDLVQEQVAGRHRAQPHGAVGAGQDQHAAREFLREHGIAAVPRAALLHALTQDLALLDQRVEALLRVALGQLDRRRHRHHRTRRLVDHVPDPAVATFRSPDLRPLHEHHPLVGRGRRQAIHDLLEVRRAFGPPAAGLG
jgi:hypothetical protein